MFKEFHEAEIAVVRSRNTLSVQNWILVELSNICFQAVYGTIKFGLYYTAKDVYFSFNPSRNESNLANLFCAIFAGELKNIYY